MTGVLGGAFDPPHLGHVALAEAAKRRFELDRLLVLVAAAPGHKDVVASAAARLDLARAAFPGEDVELDEHARTIDMLRARRLADPLLVIGADQLMDFPGWKEPDAVLDLARLGVATRPGYAPGPLARPDRVVLFDLEPHDVSSSEIRALAARGEPIAGLVPAAVADLVRRRSLYRSTPGLH